MIEVVKNRILTSDWHVLHRNIYWFLPDQRATMSGCQDPHKLSWQQFLHAERELYGRLLQAVQWALRETEVREFVMLGDLVFGLERSAGLSARLETLRTELDVVFDIFRTLEQSGVRRVLLLGNHDDHRQKHSAAQRLYESWFDAIEFFIHEDDTLFTHFPLGYSLARQATLGTSDEKYYRINKTFRKLDERLLQAVRDRPITNFHGHIHRGPFPFGLPNVTYRNVAIDILGAR